MARSRKPINSSKSEQAARPREITMTDLEASQAEDQVVTGDIHASGTPGGGSASGGLAGSNAGDGSPENADLESALGSGIFDNSGEDEPVDEEESVKSGFRRTRVDSGNVDETPMPGPTRSSRFHQDDPTYRDDDVPSRPRNGKSRGALDGLTSKQREKIRQALLSQARRIAGDVTGLTAEVLRTSGGEASGNLSNAPLHLADLGTDHFNQEMTVNFLQIENQTLRELAGALRRLDEGRYGLCDRCDRTIAPERLEALPYARYCIGCARKVEQEAEEDEFART